MSIEITTTHTITCDNAPVEDVYRELDEKFPKLNPFLGQTVKLWDDRNSSRARIANLLNKVADLTRERDELKRKLEESLAVKEKLMAENANLEAANEVILAGGSRPALPEGMRIAEHECRGRVVVSPKSDDGDFKIFMLDTDGPYFADYNFATSNTLTFLDSDPEPEPLPNPEDCKPGELYLAKAFGRDVVAKRCYTPDDNCSWIAYWKDDCYADYCSDSQITLLSRLLPDREVK